MKIQIKESIGAISLINVYQGNKLYIYSSFAFLVVVRASEQDASQAHTAVKSVLFALFLAYDT